MLFKSLIFLVLNLFVTKANRFDLLNQLNKENRITEEIAGEIHSANYNQDTLNEFINNYHGDKDLISQIIKFFQENTNVTQAHMGVEALKCAWSIVNESINDHPNYLNILGFSGKDLSDLGLEEECLGYNFSYFLFVYEFLNGSFVSHKSQRNSFIFFQQNTFFTGLCLPEVCKNICNFLFNETIDPALYSFMRNNMSIRNARIYEVGNSDKTIKKNPNPSYDYDGKYNQTKTDKEIIKYRIFYIFIWITSTILIIQFCVGIVYHFFYHPIKKSRQLKKEEEIDNDNKSDESDESSPDLFKEFKIKKENKRTCCENPICEFLFNYLSMFDNLKILLQKKNRFYNTTNFEIVTYVRIIAMILITFINNFEVLIKIPSKYFFYEKYYLEYSTVYLKYASFSVDIWICLDGFEMMYKLINFYKKYAHNNISNLLKFYFYSFYKFISFFILFFVVNYFNKFFIYLLTDGALFEYYSNHIYNDINDESKLIKFLIPGYSLYYFYYHKSSIFDNIYISKFSLILINEFYAYTLLLLIFIFSYLIKSQIFDYIILILNFISYIINYLIFEFKTGENTYYSYKLVLDNFFTTRYPHVVFNFFFLGAMSALTCFYYKDSFLSDSICTDNHYIPFKFCYKSIIFFDFLMQKGRKFWVIFFILIQVLISYSFYILVGLNDNSIFIPFNTLQKIVASYESGLFAFLFCIILILLIFIRSENVGKEKNDSSIIYLIERTNFSFFQTTNLLMYTFYCFFYFQVKLNIQNLFIVTFGLFFIICFGNLLFTLAFVFPFKMLNRKIIERFMKDKKKSGTFERPSKISEKPLLKETLDSVEDSYNQ